jgi:hypothetical protein
MENSIHWGMQQEQEPSSSIDAQKNKKTRYRYRAFLVLQRQNYCG